MSPTEGTAVVVVLGSLAPPVQGAALVTAEVIDRLVGTGASVRVINARGVGHRPQGRYHLSRAVIHIKALKHLWSAHGTPQKAFYMSGAGGAGLCYQVALALFARALEYAIVFHHHSYAYLRRRKFAMTALTFVAGRNARHVALGESMSQLLTRQYRSVGRVLVCSNAGLLAAAPALPPGERLTTQPLTVGHLSNLSVDKGVALVFDTFRVLLSRGIPARLLVAGAPSDRSSPSC